MNDGRLTNNEWEALFVLMERVINVDGLTASEKGDMVIKEAELRGWEATLVEFVNELADPMPRR